MDQGTHQAQEAGHWTHLQEDFARYLDGDGSAAERAFGSLSRILGSYFFARTRSDSDSQDLTQASLLKIHLSRASFDQSLSLKTWVFVVAHRTLIDHWRKTKRHDVFPTDDDDIVTDSDHSEKSQEDPLVRMAQRKILGLALESLKPDDRTIVYLNVEEGLSMAEIAAVVGSTEGAIKVRMHRTRKNLRQFIEKIESDADPVRATTESEEAHP